MKDVCKKNNFDVVRSSNRQNEFLRTGPKRKKNHYDWRKLTNYTFPIGQKIEVLKSGQANDWFWLDFRAAVL